MPGQVFTRADTSGAKAQNVEWFATDVTSASFQDIRASKFRLTFALSSKVIVEVTLDSGTTWYSLNSNSAITADSVFAFDVPARQADLFNMRTPAAAGTTVRFCRVDSLQEEG